MQTLSIREMRNQLGKLDSIIREEHELIITKHNKPVARILPIKETKERPSHKVLRDTLPYQKMNSDMLLRTDRDER